MGVMLLNSLNIKWNTGAHFEPTGAEIYRKIHYKRLLVHYDKSKLGFMDLCMHYGC